MLTATRHHRLAALEPVKSDSLLALIAMANADSRPNKIDVGVGVYKDGSGKTGDENTVGTGDDQGSEMDVDESEWDSEESETDSEESDADVTMADVRGEMDPFIDEEMD